jgi:two-component system, chemotaxis family, chemotaxis protein CheY
MNCCLIADDSPLVRKVARRIIEHLGFEVDEAEDGLKALDKCERRMPHTILLDWNMPSMNGLEFLRSLRSMAGGRAPRVIFCTTESAVGRIREALETGADEYIIKPFDEEMLRARLIPGSEKMVNSETHAGQTSTPRDRR